MFDLEPGKRELSRWLLEFKHIFCLERGWKTGTQVAAVHPIPHHLLGCICELTSWIQTILQPIMKEHAKLQTQIQMFANTKFM